jgi:hypothetical protein
LCLVHGCLQSPALPRQTPTTSHRPSLATVVVTRSSCKGRSIGQIHQLRLGFVIVKQEGQRDNEGGLGLTSVHRALLRPPCHRVMAMAPRYCVSTHRRYPQALALCDALESKPRWHPSAVAFSSIWAFGPKGQVAREPSQRPRVAWPWLRQW